MSMTNPTDRVEIITSVQRRRRWTASEKVRMVEETFEPGMTVSLVARRHGVAPNQLFTWRRLVAQGGLTAAGSGEEVVPASDYRALQSQVRELHRLLGKKTLETEILKEALEHAMGSKKTAAAAAVAAEGRFPMKAVAEVIGVSRSNLIERLRDRAKKRLGRPPLPDDELVADIKAVVAELPTYGYRRVHAILRRQGGLWFIWRCYLRARCCNRERALACVPWRRNDGSTDLIYVGWTTGNRCVRRPSTDRVRLVEIELRCELALNFCLISPSYLERGISDN